MTEPYLVLITEIDTLVENDIHFWNLHRGIYVNTKCI